MGSFATLVNWPQPILELLGFAALFLMTGALGFRFVAVRPWLGRDTRIPEDFRALARAAVRRAALLALVGAVLALNLALLDMASDAAEHHATLAQSIAGDTQNQIAVGLGILAIVGFALAAFRVGAGWILAAVGVIVGSLSDVFTGRWLALVNPVHELAGGMWIGTLFHVVTTGIALVLASGLSSDRRGLFARDLVNRFSPLALGSAAVLATFGVITAWRHLKTLPALWTTPYGITLIVKLCLVACVLALGAFNFRRQRPLMGSEAGAVSIRRSATAELAIAALVLIVTSVLVSVPAPRRPGRPPAASATGNPNVAPAP